MGDDGECKEVRGRKWRLVVNAVSLGWEVGGECSEGAGDGGECSESAGGGVGVVSAVRAQVGVWGW